MMRKTPLIILTAAALPFAVQAANTDFSFGGFIKADAMVSQYKDNKPTDLNAAHDLNFYIPGQTPIETAGKNVTAFDTSAQSSRFNLKTVTTLENGEKVTAFVEMDFLGATAGKQTTNPHSPRLRHAYFAYNNLTIGQTWSTFMNPQAIPDTVDLIGPSESTILVRQAQARYTMGDFQFALENSETNHLEASGTSTQKSAKMPDMIARYNLKTGGHSFSFAGLIRDLRTKNDDNTLGFGVNAAGIVKLGDDNLRFSASYGQVGRYVGIATAPDSMIVNGELEATDVFAAFASYQHFWSPQWRSSLTYSMLNASYEDDAVASSLKANEKSQSARVNLMYSPSKELTYGVELSNAKLEKINGTDGSFNRLHVTAKYAF